MARRHKRKTQTNDDRLFSLDLAKASFTVLKRKKEILNECGFPIRSKADSGQTARKLEKAYEEVKALVEKEKTMQVARNARRNKRNRRNRG